MLGGWKYSPARHFAGDGHDANAFNWKHKDGHTIWQHASDLSRAATDARLTSRATVEPPIAPTDDDGPALRRRAARETETSLRSARFFGGDQMRIDSGSGTTKSSKLALRRAAPLAVLLVSLSAPLSDSNIQPSRYSAKYFFATRATSSFVTGLDVLLERRPPCRQSTAAIASASCPAIPIGSAALNLLRFQMDFFAFSISSSDSCVKGFCSLHRIKLVLAVSGQCRGRQHCEQTRIFHQLQVDSNPKPIPCPPALV